MSPGNDNDGHLDEAIDAVAREMTAGTPGADFKSRVLARIDERERRSIWRSPWVLSPLAVAALVLIIVVVARPFQGRDRGPVRDVGTARQPAAEQAPPLQPKQDVAQAFRPAETTPDRGPERAAPQPTRSRAPIATSEIDALAPPPLDVESIRLAALPPGDSIRVDPLETITPIDVAPLGPVDIANSQRRDQ